MNSPMNIELFGITLGQVFGWAFIGLIVVATLVLGWVAAGVLRRWIERLGHRMGPARSVLISRGIAYAAYIALVLFVLWAVGLPVQGLLGWVAGAAGIAGVALGFASQTSAANIISGLFLLGERPFEEGDIIEVNGVSGEVLAVDLLSVKLRTFDNTYVRVPNETVMKTTIVNLSRFPIRRMELLVRVRPGTDLGHLREVVERVAANQRRVLNEPPPNVLFSNVIDGAVEVKIVAWAAREVFFDAKARFSVEVVAALGRSGVEVLGARREVRMVAADAPDSGAAGGA